MARFRASFREDDEGCKIWTGRLDKDGYGRFSANAARYGTPHTDKAHRWIFGVEFGFLPPVVMHKCDKPACVNWEGCLMAGTVQHNNTDMIMKGRHGHGVTGAPGGERHYKSKLTDLQTREIKALYAAGGVTQRELGELFGVSRPAVNMIVNGRRRA